MTICPHCGHKNIQGADTCEQCGHSLMSRAPRGGSPVERMIHKDRIKALSPRPALFTDPNTPVGDVLKTLVENNVGLMMVGQPDDLKGVFSERDALTRLGARHAELRDRPISEFMTPSPTTLDEEIGIAYALHQMDLSSYRHIPVTRDGEVIGIVSVRDVLKYVGDNLFSA